MFFSHMHIEDSDFMFQPQNLVVDSLKGKNIAVVQRLSSQENLRAIQVFKKMGLKVVYDLDDDVWSVPRYNPAFGKMKVWLPGFEVCSSMADLITVSTQHLKLMVEKALGKKCPPVEVIENALDYDWFKPVSEKYHKKRNGRIVIGWAGTDTHQEDIEKVIGMLPQILEEHPEVDFEIIGHTVPESMKVFFGDRVRERYFVPVAEFAANWAGWQWDISLAPVAENAFNLSKSNIKMLEAAALSIPCVASRFGEYQKFSSYSPLLKKTISATSVTDWKRKIEGLVVNPTLRTEVGMEMHSVACRYYNIRDRAKQWYALFEELLK